MGYLSRIDHAFDHAPLISLRPGDRIVLFSDCHRGTGASNDNFLKNQHLYFAALQYYYQNHFTYIELGDGDELWENRCLSNIMDIHSNVFWLLSLYQKQERLYLLYGNHDMEKKTMQEYNSFSYHAGLILEDCITGTRIHLTHGHQADFLNCVLWKLSRFLVRYLWKPLEQIGVLDPTSAARNYHVRERTECRLKEWSDAKQQILITGHTHRPVIADHGSGYFNTGSCVHPRCITCIELTNRCFTLVKWSMEAKQDRSLYVARSVLAGPVCIDNVFNMPANPDARSAAKDSSQ